MITPEDCKSYIEHNKRREVKGKPSASQLELLHRCPGAYYACQGIERDNKNMERGRLLHAAMAISLETDVTDFAGFEESDIEYLDNAIDAIAELELEGWEVADIEVFMEGDLCYGTADLVMCKAGDVLIVDHKFGDEVVDIKTATQLTVGYTYLVNNTYSPNCIYGMINQPANVNFNPVIKMDREYALAKMSEIDELIFSNKNFFRGPHCARCNAVGTEKCGAFDETVKEIEKIREENEIVNLDNARHIFEVFSVFEKFMKNYKAELKKIAENGTEIPGLKLYPGRRVYSLKSYTKLKEAALEAGINDVKLSKAATFSISKLKEIWPDIPEELIEESRAANYFRRTK